MQLYINDTSPFSRLVLITAIECEFDNIALRWVDPWMSSKALTDINPYSTVPTLVIDNDHSLYESSLICEYLISQVESSGRLAPIISGKDIGSLKLHALSKNLMDFTFRKVIIDRFYDDESCLSLRSKNALKRAVIKLDSIELPVKKRFETLSDIGLLVALKYIAFRVPDIYSTVGDNVMLWVERMSEIASVITTSPDSLKGRPRLLKDCF